ncbi:MAG TPA: hypothetical protein VI362_06630 [Ignavibacteriaceae bacterium]|nr:hypothetical protein [Ignavibacteriaceae bacterium]
MNEQNIIVTDVAKVIAKDFQVAGFDSLIPVKEVETIDRFKKYLTERLTYLLENKYDVLINILYRIDVNEEKLAKLFSEKKRDSIPEALADLIIERQLQKAKMRQQYRLGNI